MNRRKCLTVLLALVLILGLTTGAGAAETQKKRDVFSGLGTSGDAQVLGRDHIGYDWAEIDWSSAGGGYVTVRVNELPEGPSVRVSCRVRWDEDGKCRYGTTYTLTEGEWTIPLFGGSTEYLVYVQMSFLACEHYLTEAERAVWDAPSVPLAARFHAVIDDPDRVWVLSAPDVDFAHAPLTRAKALEITGGCKTDAEKITAVFHWVAENIAYDHEMAGQMLAETERDRSKDPRPCSSDPVNGKHRLPPDSEELGYTDQSQLSLDTILTRRSGVCEHYAVLMTGMLRSLGVPCKMVSGAIRASDGRWWAHGWVAVKPADGTLDQAALGAGRDYTGRLSGRKSEPTGWTRLDPTNGLLKPEYTSNDENYRVTSHH